MPKRYFQRFPVTQYDVDNDGDQKIVVDVLRRVKLRAAAKADGGVFYNYQMQDGDNAEIIADKYYGSSEYHWVVLMMNDRIDHTYDFTLDDENFENYIVGKYGSVDRSKGLSKNLSSSDYMNVVIGPQWHAYEQHSGSGFGANTEIEIGTIPAGNSTAIIVYDEKDNDPFSSIYVDDVVTIFVPEDFYDSANTTNYPKTQYATSARVTGRCTYRPEGTTSTFENRNYMISLDLNSNTYPALTWDKDNETVSIQTAINHFKMDYHNDAGTIKLASSVYIDQARYANNSNPNSPDDLTKKIVSNYTYEAELNESKRTISLLKAEYLPEFLKQFDALVKE